MRRILSVRRRMFSIAVVSALAATLFGFGTGVAQAATSTSFSIFTKAVTAKSGIPYKMTMFVSKSSGSSNAFLNITFTRIVNTTSASLSQTHSFSFTIAASDLTIDGTDLLPTKIDTHTHLGQFGKIDMALKNPTSLSKRTFRCPSPNNDIVLGSQKTRKGNLSGTFHFVANDNFFHTINKSSLPATVQKFTSTGKTCPGGGGGTPCITGFSFSVNDTDAPLFATANKPLSSTGKARISMGYTNVVGKATESHNISGTVPRTAFGFSSSGDVTVKGGALAPFAADTIHFNGSNPNPITTGHCKTTFFTETFASGDLLAKFQSGGQKKIVGTHTLFPGANKTVKVP